MFRDPQKYINEYDKKFEHSSKGAIYCSDIVRLINLNKSTHNGKIELISLVSDNIKFGIIIGYRLAKRERRKEYKKHGKQQNNSN